MRFLSLFSYAVTLSCLGFVIWISIQCVTRYIRKPQGTLQTIENTAHLPFPAITICGYPGYNEQELERCGIASR